MEASETINRAHWGQLEEENFDILISSKDTTRGDKPKSNWGSFDVPPLYQPCSTHRGPKKEKSPRNLLWMKAPLDNKDQNYIFQSIELQHFKRRMRYMLSAAHSHQNELQKGTNFDSPALPSPPIPPKRFCSSEGRLVSQTQPSFMSAEFSSDADKRGLENKQFQCPIELDMVSARQLMSKSIAGVTAHAGFELATESTLNTLTDVTSEYSLKLCKALKTYLEYQPTDEIVTDGFSHILKQFTSDDLISLQDYWLTRVKQVALKLEKEDLSLLEEYNALKDSSIHRVVIKEEKM